MAAMASVGVALKTLLIVLFCTMVASFVHLFVFGDYFTCFDMNARWEIQIVVDFSIFFVAFGAWYTYKESSWIIPFVLVVVMYFLGSIITIGYILTQFYKLSPEESSKDPLYFVLARRKRRDVVDHPKRSLLATTKIIFSALGCLALGTMIFTIIVDISPSYIKSFTSCVVANSTDMFNHIVILSIWIAYKESSWTSAFCWILLLLCFRGVILCIYIVRQLFNLSPQQHISDIIFKDNNREFHSSDPPLMARSDV